MLYYNGNDIIDTDEYTEEDYENSSFIKSILSLIYDDSELPF